MISRNKYGESVDSAGCDVAKKKNAVFQADGPSRMRTYTMKQMDLMQKAKKKSEIRSIPWKTPPADFMRTASPFEERRVVKPDHFESTTSKLIAESPTLVENPFLEFARFEASVSVALLLFSRKSSPNSTRFMLRSDRFYIIDTFVINITIVHC